MITINIELRTMFSMAEKDAVMLKLTRILCKQLLAQAALMQERFPCKLKITCGEFNEAEEEVLLFDEDGNEFDTEVIEAIERFDIMNKGKLARVVVNAPKRPDVMEDSDEEEAR